MSGFNFGGGGDGGAASGSGGSSPNFSGGPAGSRPPMPDFGGGPGTPHGGQDPAPAPAPAPASIATTKAPPDPALSTVILMATDAVKMDNAGCYKAAKQSYMLAAEELIKVCRSQPDPLRRTAYRKRADTYLKRAEAIHRMLRHQVNEKRQSKEAERIAQWYEKALGSELESREGEKVPTAEVLRGKKIACIFVGANWNPACKEFLPELQKFHTLVQSEHEDELEIIYASQDRTRVDFDAFYKAQSWPCVPFENKSQVGFLLAHCKFYGNKVGLVVLDATNGKVLVRDAAASVLKDPSPAIYESWTQLLPKLTK